MAVAGIDVSQYQGNIDFNKVKAAGKKFVLIRAGYGRYLHQKDPYFEQNYNKAKAAGLDVGAYWYSYAKTVSEAKQEAEICMQVIKGKQFEYPIYFDFEEQSQFALGKAVCSELIKTFCNALEAGGYWAGIYIYRAALQNYVTTEVANRYAVAVAEYGNKLNYSGPYGVWQYSGSGYCNGISGQVDLDYAYVDYPKLIKAKGLNGFPKPSATEKILDTGSCYKLGETTVGALAVKEMLRLAKQIKLHDVNVTDTKTYDQSAVDAVKALQKRWGYKQTGQAGENFVKRLYEALQ